LAWRKKLKVREQMENHSWTRGLWRMSSVEEMVEFVRLWDLVQDVQFSDREDQIVWKFTADGQYTAKSAYDVQFKGSFCTITPNWIWAAHPEPKHRFFTWLLLQEKILTADKLQERNWPCNPLCPFCSLAPESAQHICLQCPFAQRVWELVQAWTGNLVSKLARCYFHYYRGLVASIFTAYASNSAKNERGSDDVYCLEFVEGAK